MPKALVFSMQKVGSSTVMAALKDIGIDCDRGYFENVLSLHPLGQYDHVIVPVRDPIARNISWFFEVFGENALGEDFSSEDHTYPLRWFEDVFEPLFKFDVYKNSFDQEKGWQISGKYLFIQIEKMTSSLPDAIEALTGIRPRSFFRANTVTTRKYGERYKKFIEETKFDGDFIAMMYENDYVRHFYSKKDISEMRKRWIKK